MSEWKSETNIIEDIKNACDMVIKQQNLKVPCEVYTRVCGFYRPVSQMNKGKQQEVKERLPYNLGFSNRRFL